MTNPNHEAAGRRWCPHCQSMVNTRIRIDKKAEQFDCAVCGLFLESISNQAD